jgi:hypothetical protein
VKSNGTQVSRIDSEEDVPACDSKMVEDEKVVVSPLTGQNPSPVRGERVAEGRVSGQLPREPGSSQ